MGPWSLLPFLCHCFIINPVSMLFIKFSYQSFTLPGLVLYQDVLIRNLLEDSFFKCRERLVKGQCSLTVDILTSLCGWRFWNLSLSSVTCWPESEPCRPCIDSYKLWASVTQLCSLSLQGLQQNQVRATCLYCASWSSQDKDRSFWIKNTTLFSSWSFL